MCGSLARYSVEHVIAGDARQLGRDSAAAQIEAQAGKAIETQFLDKREAVEAFIALLEDPNAVISGANIAMFDLLVLAVAAQVLLGRDVMSLIFKALEEGRIYDIQIAEQLNAVADGTLGRDPRTGGMLVSPETGRRAGYSLSICVDLNTGRKDAKANDDWRQHYHLLDNVPPAEWPTRFPNGQAAIDYPQDDVFNNHDVTLRQIGYLPRVMARHDWGPAVGGVACVDCGERPSLEQKPCLARRAHRNLHDLANQVWTAFAMHLGGAWGFRVNQSRVDTIETEAMRGREDAELPFIQAGLLRRNPDGSVSQNQAAIKKRVVESYGGGGECPTCAGTGKVLSPSAKPVRCRECRGKDPNCFECLGVGKKAYGPMINCFGLDETGQKTKTCDGTGFLIGDEVPRTDGEGVGYGRDVLSESADEILINLAEHLEDAKTLSVYVPYLRRGRTCLECGQTGSDDSPHANVVENGVDRPCRQPGYRDIPLTLSPNVILETGRTSYRGPIQQFPRAPGYWVELDYFEVVEVPDDYELQPGETRV